MVWTPHATVAVIAEQNERFLMVEEISDGLRVFNQPAGHIEPGETIAGAAIRETREETGWIVTPKALVGIYIYTAPNNVTYHRYCLAADPVTSTDEPLDEEIVAAHWLTEAEIVSKGDSLRSPLVMRCIDDYLRRQRFPLSLIYEHPPHK